MDDFIVNNVNLVLEVQYSYSGFYESFKIFKDVGITKYVHFTYYVFLLFLNMKFGIILLCLIQC